MRGRSTRGIRGAGGARLLKLGRLVHACDGDIVHIEGGKDDEGGAHGGGGGNLQGRGEGGGGGGVRAQPEPCVPQIQRMAIFGPATGRRQIEVENSASNTRQGRALGLRRWASRGGPRWGLKASDDAARGRDAEEAVAVETRSADGTEATSAVIRGEDGVARVWRELPSRLSLKNAAICTPCKR